MATVINLNDSLPAAPAGRKNVKWQGDALDPRNVSAYPDDGGVNVQSGTSYTLVEGDNRKLVYFDNVSSPPESIAVAISPSADLGSTFFCWLENHSEGTVTLTPYGSETIDGTSSLALATDEGLMLFSKGSNLYTSRGKGGTGSFTAGGDLSGSDSSQTVVGLRGKALDAATVGSPSDGDVIVYDSASGKYKAAARSGGAVSGSALCVPNSLAGNTGSWSNFSAFADVSSLLLLNTASSFKVKVLVYDGTATVLNMAVLRTLHGSATVIDATQILWSGVSNPSLAAGEHTSDTVSLAIDTSHDYWLVCAFGSTGTMSVGSGGAGPVGGYTAGNHTADSTIPSRTNGASAYFFYGIYSP